MTTFSLPKLPYSYNALEPYIDATTMEVHHTKHHQTYVNNLNNAIAKMNVYKDSSLLNILQNVIYDQKKTDKSKELTQIRNNAGGHYNHSFFWLIMGPVSNTDDIKEDFMNAINRSFGSFNEFRTEFEKESLALFGSGFIWLCYDTATQELSLIATKDQDDPIMYNRSLIPLLTLDVWEHAYYLKYQNARKSYIEAWWNVVNWKTVNMFYAAYAVKNIMVEIESDGTLKKTIE